MGGTNILIIDDDVDLQKTLSGILRSKGYETFAASSGNEGLALLGEKFFSVVFIDLMLPDIPGIKVLERIKSVSQPTETIILTGNASLETAIEATNKGAFCYLLKPYDIDELILNTERAIGKQQAETALITRNRELQRCNFELTTLYDISRILCRTTDAKVLLQEVMQTLMEKELFNFRHGSAAFLVEEDRLRMVANIGIPEAELKSCRNVRFGKCLCGLAASMGEIVISGDSAEDNRHVIGHLKSSAHGHIILPLKTINGLVGVLCFRTQPGKKPGEEEITLLSTLGSQIAVAVNNARLYEETRSDSLLDPLTGLGNRRSLTIQMEKSVEAACRYGEKLSVIMLDIDHFKKYNDENGHLKGDRLLSRLAQILMHEIRKPDYIFRYGGEEFLVILPATDRDKALEAAERMRKAVEEKAGVTISLGVASYREGVRDGMTLIRSADAALYRAKQNGRNRVEVSPPSAHRKSVKTDR